MADWPYDLMMIAYMLGLPAMSFTAGCEFLTGIWSYGMASWVWAE